ncbi:hypothetical protein KKF81_03315 [Candidatus Micrarchaeota archaeon]|nr:hypothetical protein [Candidatus Micrarchaeota archaeon]MBU1165952.1 hypothetical protein [Candidatus Micrarchaeota archaeon]MBU1886856.1 hypothetical protein [Candidatus Micrarchaeota archaeon]
MAVIKKSDIEKLPLNEIDAKIAQLELAMLELHGEGRRDKLKTIKKTISKLKTKQHNVKKAYGKENMGENVNG